MGKWTVKREMFPDGLGRIPLVEEVHRSGGKQALKKRAELLKIRAWAGVFPSRSGEVCRDGIGGALFLGAVAVVFGQGTLEKF
jgi:hypothetical protein